jgi:exonuclease SbcD
LLHTADWHLGRILFGVHLTEDQAVLLDQLVALAREAAVDVVLIAGDVYDRAVPPAEAVALLSDTLDRLVRQVGCQVVLCAGNHDSPRRLGFCAEVLRGLGLHIFGPPAAEPRPVVLPLDEQLGLIFGLPFVEPLLAREALADPGLADHNAVVHHQTAACRQVAANAQARANGRRIRSILVSHAFVVGGRESESERPLSVGGAGTVAVDCFEGFDYVALGHLHRPQAVVAGRVEYSGSLFKYSFAETDHTKTVQLVEFGARGEARIERLALAPRRDVRVLQGRLSEILAAAEHDERRDDYVLADLTDEDILRAPMEQVRTRYPNVLHVNRPGLAPPGPGPGPDRRKLGPAELFAQFYRERRDRELSAQQSAAFAQVVESLMADEREV